MTPPLVLVTDGEERAALAVVRSLGRAGHPVAVVAHRRRSLAGASRYARQTIQVPAPLLDPHGFVQSVRAAVTRLGATVLMPVSEAALRALLPVRHQFPDVCVPFPSAEVFARLSDKRLVLDAGAELGLAIPAQHVVAAPADIPAAERHPISFPVAVKPSRSVIAGAGGPQRHLSVQYAADAAALGTQLRELPAEAFPVLVQERIVGPGVGIFLLRWQGDLLAVFAHRRIRDKPPSGGVSVYRESISADPTLVAQSLALLDRFAWSGVAMVEYKVQAATGRAYLMEVNARFWGSLQLAIDAGVDFPRLLVQAALRGRPRPIQTYVVGLRSRWWWGDVDHSLLRVRSAPRNLGALLNLVPHWGRRERNEIFRWDDWRPFVRETLDWVLGQ